MTDPLKPLMTRKKFSTTVMNRWTEEGGSIMEMIIDVCESIGHPIEDSKRLIDTNLKALLEKEAIALNMLKGEETSDLSDLV